ncbi:MAG: CPBP family intramembrane glutamic endopeptidase [Nitrososphaerota archaeon]|nr:CPBP family intramembrane glutamic endopeptidase [Nitrososphaerota archaeon]
MKRAFALSVMVYFTVALTIMLAAFLFHGESWPPIFLSFMLLVPLHLWKRKYTEKTELSKTLSGKSMGAVVGWTLALFLLALTVRVPSALIFKMPYEKAPIIYLLTFTIVLVEETELTVFGFKTQKMAKALLNGAVFFIILQGTILFVHCTAVHALTGQAAISFNFTLFLTVMPFHTLLVGISEEGLFRGYIQTSIEPFGALKAIFFQAVLFGLWHFVWNLSPFNPLGMLQYITFSFLFGLLFGYFYSKTKNLVPLILVHGLWNSFQSGVIRNTEVLDKLAQTPFPTQILVWFLPYAIAVPAALAFTKYWVKEI